MWAQARYTKKYKLPSTVSHLPCESRGLSLNGHVFSALYMKITGWDPLFSSDAFLINKTDEPWNRIAHVARRFDIIGKTSVWYFTKSAILNVKKSESQKEAAIKTYLILQS